MTERDPFGTLFDLHKGICKVGTGSGSGTGFLCKVSIDGRQGDVFGLITTSYTLDVRDLANPFMLAIDVFQHGKKYSIEMTINPAERFRFSCAILDTTFVHLRENEIENLKANGRRFLKLDTLWEGNRGDEVLVVQQQIGMKSRLTNGAFIRDHGVYLLHTSKSKIGSWGSPLALKDGRVIGLHKRRATHKTEDMDVAVSSKAIVGALSLHCRQAHLPNKLISNPIRFNEASESRILEHELSKCADKDNRFLIFVTAERNMEINPKYYANDEGESYDINPVTESESNIVNPVWFVPTNHGWYWTPTDPFDRTQETNWMSINTPEVVGGKGQHKKKMCREDWQVAKWLKSTGNIMNTSS